MFEIGIFCVIFLAVAYWAALWLMGRREDVLDGVRQSEPPAEEPVRPLFPKRPQVRNAMPARPVETRPEQPAFRQSLLNMIKQDLNQLVQKWPGA